MDNNEKQEINLLRFKDYKKLQQIITADLIECIAYRGYHARALQSNVGDLVYYELKEWYESCNSPSYECVDYYVHRIVDNVLNNIEVDMHKAKERWRGCFLRTPYYMLVAGYMSFMNHNFIHNEYYIQLESDPDFKIRHNGQFYEHVSIGDKS